MLVIVMRHEIHRHMDPDDLERYSLGNTTPDEVARMEEHLLVCEQCRCRLDETEGYAIAMKAAAAELGRSGGRRRWIPILVAAACVVLCVSVALRWQVSLQPAVAVNLTATRSSAAATVPADRALDLRPDLTGLPTVSALRLEVVNQTGTQVWRGDLSGQRARIPGQSSGMYFVRIYTHAGELLREYGLQIGK